MSVSPPPCCSTRRAGSVAMRDASLYLFDGYNLLHAGPYSDRRELADMLASYVAGLGARGVLVFDGSGDDEELGPLSVRYAEDASKRVRCKDDLSFLHRLARFTST